MTDSFDALPWHDAELLEISVDRRHAGERDEVRLRIAWPQGEEATLLFRGCYSMNAAMNFGVIATEQILAARIVEQDPGLIALRKQWAPLGLSLQKLRCFQIETNSTASVIRIYAQEFEIG